MFGLEVSAGAAVVVDGIEWTVERTLPQLGQVVLVAAGGQRMQAKARWARYPPRWCRGR
jgi:hypothetical protein